MTAASIRHRWSLDVNRVFDDRDVHIKTERTCTNPGCTIVKVTRHEWTQAQHSWIEFYDNGERIVGDRTPPCRGVQQIGKLEEAKVI